MPSWSPDGESVYFVRTTEDVTGLWPARGAVTRLPARRPEPDARQGRRQRRAGAPRDRQVQEGPLYLGVLDPRSRSCRRTARRSRSSPTRRTPTTATSSSSSSTSATKKFKRPERRRERRRSATRTRPGGRTASSCCTCGTAATGARGRRSSTATTSTTKKSTALTGPGYLEPSYSPDGQYIAATKTTTLRDRRRHPRRVERARAPARHQRRVVVGAGLVAARRRDRLPPHRRPDRRPQARRRSTATRPTGRSRRRSSLTEVSGPRRRLAPGLVRPGGRAADADPGPDGRADAIGVGERHRSLSPRPVATYLERLAARSAATGTVLCLGLDPDPAALPPGFSRGPRRRRAVRDARSSRRPHRSPRRSSRTSRSSRPSGRPGWRRSSGSGRRLPADLPVVADAKRGDIGSTAARQAVALFDVLGADAVTVNPYLGAEAIAPLLERPDRFAYVLCRTSNPGAGELQDLVRRRRTRAHAARPAEPLHAARGPAAPPRWGPGGTVGLVVGATAPDELRAHPRDRARARRSSCPGVGRAGRRGRAGPRATGRRRRRRPAGGPAAGCSSTCRAGSRGAAGRGRRRAIRRDPVERVAAAAARLGSAPPCATLAAAQPAPRARHATGRRERRRLRQEHADDAEHRSPRAHHHPGDRAPHPRPGQAARGRARRSARASANSARPPPTSRTP